MGSGGLRRLLAFLTAALLAGCGAMNVVSEGGDGNLMLRGNDPVAYFTQGKAVAGNPLMKTQHQGFTYRFASEDHFRRFISAPDRYVPQFGGFCANGMAYAVPIAGETDSFKIIEGRLYLFGGARSKLYFEMDQERNLQLARQYWETEVRDSNWRLQSWKRLVFRVPHYKTNAQLAEEYERRFGRRPG
jgi:YHS domain-containing protein